MSKTAEPLFLYDLSNRDQPGNLANLDAEGTLWHAACLEWARANGINPETTFRVEVRENESGLVAEVGMYVTDEQGRKLLAEDREDFQRRTETVPLSSLPPLPEIDAE